MLKKDLRIAVLKHDAPGQVPENLARFERIADAPDAQGPMSGLLDVMRWAPRASETRLAKRKLPKRPYKRRRSFIEGCVLRIQRND